MVKSVGKPYQFQYDTIDAHEPEHAHRRHNEYPAPITRPHLGEHACGNEARRRRLLPSSVINWRSDMLSLPSGWITITPVGPCLIFAV